MDIENIEAKWKTYEKLCKRLSDTSLNELLETLGERIIMCPASSRVDQVGCHSGGMMTHSLDVTLVMRTLNDALEFKLPVASVLKVGLLHDLGKVGSLEHDYFIEQDSDWHRDKLGQYYKFNEELNKMSVSHRTLYLLQHFGVTLSTDEWLAIQLAQGSHFEENRFYVGHTPSLALLLQQAKSIANHRHRHT